MIIKRNYTPGKEHTAKSMGSGTLDVLATPAVIAFAENACHLSIVDSLEEEQTTVGTAIDIAHLKASSIDESVCLEVTLIEQSHRTYNFSFTATVANQLIAKGTHQRVSVDIERFMAKIK